MRQVFGLVIGLAIGMAGAILFQQSLPPEEGSVQEELESSQAELRRARREIAALAAGGGRRGNRTTVDEMRTIAERLRDGEEVSLDHVFFAMKPALRDLWPLFDRIRQVEEDEHFDALAGQFSREYDLSEKDRVDLKRWLAIKGAENARRLKQVVDDPASGFVEFMRASRFDQDHLNGLDEFMESRLEGDDLARFREERLGERVESVQAEANRRLQRINEAVGLDDDQLDPMFAVMARGAQDFRPGMDFDGMGAETGPLPRERQTAAIRNVLRGDQLDRFEQFQEERRRETQAEMDRFGLSLPEDWQLLDDENF